MGRARTNGRNPDSRLRRAVLPRGVHDGASHGTFVSRGRDEDRSGPPGIGVLGSSLARTRSHAPGFGEPRAHAPSSRGVSGSPPGSARTFASCCRASVGSGRRAWPPGRGGRGTAGARGGGTPSRRRSGGARPRSVGVRPARRRGGGPARLRLQDPVREVGFRDGRAGSHDHGPLDDVLELADVPRPGVALEDDDRPWGDALDPAPSLVGGELLAEDSASRGTSSGRSRSGGIWIWTTFRR